MRRLGPLAIAYVGLVIFGAASALAAQEDTEPNAPAHMQWTDDGPILVTPAGVTLYTYSIDANRPGKSACTNVPAKTYRDEQGGMGPAPLIGADTHPSCAEKWPPYLADERAQPIGDFSLIDRPEGGKQWAYRGAPLYLFSRDHQPGDRLGIASFGFGGGFGRGFRPAMVPINLPAGLKFTRREEGLVLTTANGEPVYTPRAIRFTKTCLGCNADLFPPILAPELARVSGDWSTVDAGAGRRQFTFKGKPLFAAPQNLKEYEIADAGGWEMVVFRKGPGRPSEIGTRLALIGDVYTDKAGRTLYTFNCTAPAQDGVRCDAPGDPAGYWVALCGDAKECARRWHPYLASPHARPVGEWSIVDVAYPMFTTNPGVTYPPEAPRVRGWAFRGTPVYTYYEDKEPGDIWGDSTKWIGGSSFFAMRVPGRENFN
jgi:predicted lipoprotein with Yx(FWY)xxD motif